MLLVELCFGGDTNTHSFSFFLMCTISITKNKNKKLNLWYYLLVNNKKVHANSVIAINYFTGSVYSDLQVQANFYNHKSRSLECSCVCVYVCVLTVILHAYIACIWWNLLKLTAGLSKFNKKKLSEVSQLKHYIYSIIIITPRKNV